MRETPLITLIDDDRELCALIAGWLSQEGFDVDACHTAQGALSLLAGKTPDAVVLDVMFPDGSGLDLIKHLRQAHPLLPVLMLSARGEPLDRVLGLELGADDYLAKPCDPRELTARLRALLRRNATTAQPLMLTVGDLTLHPQRGVATVDDRDVTLTLTEARLLEALLATPDVPVDKAELSRIALGRKPVAYDRSLDVHVSNLRKKLGAYPDGRARIIGLRGRGYFYVREPAAEK